MNNVDTTVKSGTSKEESHLEINQDQQSYVDRNQ